MFPSAVCTINTGLKRKAKGEPNTEYSIGYLSYHITLCRCGCLFKLIIIVFRSQLYVIIVLFIIILFIIVLLITVLIVVSHVRTR